MLKLKTLFNSKSRTGKTRKLGKPSRGSKAKVYPVHQGYPEGFGTRDCLENSKSTSHRSIDDSGTTSITPSTSSVPNRHCTYEDVWFSRSPKEHGVKFNQLPPPLPEQFRGHGSPFYGSSITNAMEAPVDYFVMESSEDGRRNGLDEPDYRAGRIYDIPVQQARAQKPRIVRGMQRVKSMKAEIFAGTQAHRYS